MGSSRAEVYKRVGCSRVEVYKRVRSSRVEVYKGWGVHELRYIKSGEFTS